MRDRGIHGEVVSFHGGSFRLELSANPSGGGTLYFVGKGPREKEYEFRVDMTKDELAELAEMVAVIAAHAEKLHARYVPQLNRGKH